MDKLNTSYKSMAVHGRRNIRRRGEAKGGGEGGRRGEQFHKNNPNLAYVVDRTRSSQTLPFHIWSTYDVKIAKHSYTGVICWADSQSCLLE